MPLTATSERPSHDRARLCPRVIRSSRVQVKRLLLGSCRRERELTVARRTEQVLRCWQDDTPLEKMMGAGKPRFEKTITVGKACPDCDELGKRALLGY